MMRKFFLIIALLSGGAAFWLWQDLPLPFPLPISPVAAPAPDGMAAEDAAAPVTALVAARDIAVGQRIEAADVTWGEVGGTDRSGLILRQALPGADRMIASFAVQQAVGAGGPILWSNLMSRQGETLSSRVAEGQFALSIVVSEATAAGGLVMPGDRVDLIQTQGRTEGGGTAARVIARDLLVLAVDQAMTRPAEGGALPGRTLTLQLSEAQVPDIAAANAAGGISVALRPSRTPDTPSP